MRDRPTEKIRDMTRSVLPSRARKMAKEARQRIHRGARRQNKMFLNWLEDLEPEDFELDEGFFWETEENLTDEKETRSQIGQMVQERRNADNLSGFLRWAKQNTRSIESEVDRHFYIKNKIGSSVIKDHALGHFVSLRWASNPFYFRSILDYPVKRELGHPTPWKNYDQLLNWIEEAINLDHAGFNRFLKKVDYLFRSCQDHNDPSKRSRCWIDAPTLEKTHDDTQCQSKTLLICLELKRKTPEINLSCWVPKLERRHSKERCLSQKNYVESIEDAKNVADFFWQEYHYHQETFPREELLIDFLKWKEILH